MAIAQNEMFTELPTASNANLSDIICAVQGYVNPGNLGTSVQENLQQVFSLFLANMVLNYPGNPNGNLAGTRYQLCWDTFDSILFVCTSTGTVSSAVWTAAGNPSSSLSAFVATISTPQTAVTGDDTAYTVIFDTAGQNVGGNYNTSTGIFTAPQNGFYLFTSGVQMQGVNINNTSGLVYFQSGGLVSSAPMLFAAPISIYNGGIGTNYACNGSLMDYLTTGQTVNVVSRIYGVSKNIAIESGFFSGRQLF